LIDQEEIHNQCLSDDPEKHIHALEELENSFSFMPDKQQAWNDLLRLTNDEDWHVRYRAANALVSSFSQVPDKQQAWNDLHRLTNDKNSIVKYSAADALSSAFSQVPDKQQAWNDLLRLTNDEDRNVKCSAVSALSSSFSQVPDKQQAWNDLHRLTSDEDRNVRSYSNHSLGRVSIFMASQAETEENYKKELEKAIEFFETAAKESRYINPAQFCFPFYRSFYTIVFKKQEAREEVNKYLEEAKSAIEGSESKKQLFEAVQNLAEALKEVQNMGNLDLSVMKDELNSYRKYCDYAAELMKCTGEKAPFATEVLRKGFPILDRNLKELLNEIQKKTAVIREQTRGTQFEKLGNELNQNSQSLLQVRDQVGLEKQVNIMQNIMKNICSKFTEDQKGEACELLSMMYAEPSLEDKIPLMNNILSKFSHQLGMTTNLKRIEEKLDTQLNHINFDISKIKFNSSDILSDLEAMKEELEKLSKIEGLSTLSIEKLDSMQADNINSLNNDILDRLDEIKILIHELSEDNNEIYEEYSRRLDELKQSKLDMLLQRYSSVISLIEFVISGISIAR